MTTTTAKPRVVVADDSALMRRIVTNVLTKGGIDVIGAAKDGDEALALCERETPDAMTLDLAMPGLGGIDVLKALKQRGGSAIPVVVVSAFSPAHGAYAVDALAEGAFELVPKPADQAEVGAFEQNLLTKILVATKTRRLGGHLRSARPSRGGNGVAAASAVPAAPAIAAEPASTDGTPDFRVGRLRRATSRALVIATSTGGPRALAEVIPGLPSPLGLGTLIVQHMPAGFTASLAARLDRSGPLSVREAEGGELLEPGVALIAPGGRHLRLTATGQTALSDEAPLGGLRPRADLLIEDAAAKWGDRLTLVVLTGMGNDGLRGAREVRRHGGRILVEAEQTCTVYGMPRAVVEAGLADEVLPLDQMSAAITAEVNP
ncbi:MAG TPA: chemotaxis-specific protein-glutamate methyltransferase CheB [Solirubrobacteraceae bacterium]|nr:chemotaxis-specific protein-glutamate methyltransferase CheB [Solirubrobacteraceae bacterium]